MSEAIETEIIDTGPIEDGVSAVSTEGMAADLAAELAAEGAAKAEAAAKTEAKAEKAAKEPSKSIDEAIEKAMAKAQAKADGKEAPADKADADKKAKAERGEDGKFAKREDAEGVKLRSEEEVHKASRRELGRLERELARLTGQAGADDIGEEGGDHSKEEVAERIAKVQAELAKMQSEGKDVRPPAHLLPSERQMWARTPRSIQAAVDRMTQGYEAQIAEHKEAVEFRTSLKQYDDMAKAAGIPIAEAMERYVSMDKKLAGNFGQGLAEIAHSFGKNPTVAVAEFMRAAGVQPQQLAQYLAGQPAQQPQAQQQRPADPQVAHLQQELAQMKQYMQQQQQAQIEAEKAAETEAKYREIEEKIINPMRAEMPRYDELSEHIAKYLKSGMIDPSLSPDLKLREAYHAVDRIYPALHGANAAEAGDLDEPANVTPLPRKKQISGSPVASTRSNVKKGPAPSIDEALERAFRSSTR